MHSGPSLQETVDVVQRLLERFGKSGAPLPEFLKSELPLQAQLGFGSATSCVQIESSELADTLLIDAGSGIRSVQSAGGASDQTHLFLTHFHWDHTCGLPFFHSVYRPGHTLHIYSIDPEVEAHVRLLFRKPQFPVPFDSLGSKVVFHKVSVYKPIPVGPFVLTPFFLDHPDPCVGYRVEGMGNTYLHCVDTEGVRRTQDELGEDAKFYRGADLMFFDAQYSDAEYEQKKGWGHSTTRFGLELAAQFGIKEVLFGHHEPGVGNQIMQKRAQELQTELDGVLKKHPKLQDLKVSFAIEGMSRELVAVSKR